jgi:hypothetical protein
MNMKTLVIATSVLAAGLLFGGSVAHAADEYVTHCSFRTKSVTLAIVADASNSNAAISVDGGADVPAWREHATDGAGYLIHKTNTGTIWFAGGAHRESSVLLQGKWYPLQCGEFAFTSMPDATPVPTYTAEAPAPEPSSPSAGGDTVPIFMVDGFVHVQVVIGRTPVNMTVDTGANISSIHTSLANSLLASGQATELEPSEITLAGGSTVTQRKISVNRLTLGSHTRYAVPMTVINDDADMLLGLPVLNAIGKFSIDAVAGVLTFG